MIEAIIIIWSLAAVADFLVGVTGHWWILRKHLSWSHVFKESLGIIPCLLSILTPGITCSAHLKSLGIFK